MILETLRQHVARLEIKRRLAHFVRDGDRAKLSI